jgi:hypothetical protein
VGARRTRDSWARLVAAFAKSQQTEREFCAERRINERTFRWWGWKLRDSKPAAATSLVRVLPVTVAPPALAPTSVRASELTVELPGVAVRVPVGVDTKFAADLIAELRTRC